ncbi:MAG: peptide chain release factor 2 [Bdellovibrionales bacterium]|nr:peptide chain release factor 2 [Bdellovibrionales bacterium]
MQEEIVIIEKKLNELSQAFSVEEKRKELEAYDLQMSQDGFWDDPEKASQVQKERSQREQIVRNFDQMREQLGDAQTFCQMLEEDPSEELEKEVQTTLNVLKQKIEDMEFQRVLGGEMDRSGAIVSINSGAGGTESQDWAAMLLRMYLRWAELRGFSAAIIDALPGEAAGYKNVTITIDGEFAYGYLRSEAGIHRLVRISPFDSNARRHTSFASVMVMPQIEDDVDIEINESDLRIDTFRASGAGGQHVNTTDSAVRITHMPTNIVVSCQNERSQHKNKASAMKILKARLYEKQQEENEKTREQLQGEKRGIDFGSQIRSYVLHPYQMIKDHRTNFEMGNTQAVLDGQLEGFIRAFLLWKAGHGA